MYIFGNRVEVIQGDAPVRPAEFLLQENGVAVNLSGETVNVCAVDEDGTALFDREATINDAGGGEVWVSFSATETGTVGEHRLYLYLVDYPDTFPTGSYIEFVVTAK